jgi:hypothetical protein
MRQVSQSRQRLRREELDSIKLVISAQIFEERMLMLAASAIRDLKRASMRKQYLHLSVSPCDKCNGPAVAGSLAVRENEISKETDIRRIGEICLSCGHRQHRANMASFTRHFLPVEWQPVRTPKRDNLEPNIAADLVSHR